jgi:ADP-ribose pyrophosphatase
MTDRISVVRDETLHQTRFLSFQRRTYLAEGIERGWEMVTRRNTAGIVACLPVTARGEAVFLSQYRIPLGRRVIELVAGLVKPGESPVPALSRELSEEAGLRAGAFRKIADFTTSAGLTDEVIETYVALDCVPDPKARHSGEAAEDIRVHAVPLAESWAWLLEQASGGLVDPKTFAALGAHLLSTSQA